MITCTVCGHPNDDLAVTCISCKSYLQAKVDNLDLFATFWGLAEAPRKTFKRIVLARTKNYVILLSSLLGMSIAFAVSWYMNLGRLFKNPLVLVLGGIMAGPFIGTLWVLLVSLILVRTSRVMHGKATLRNTYAVVAYASMPVIFSLVLVFPVELAIFGQYLFDNNPPPLVINPVLYVALLGFDAVAVCWSWFLLVEGTVVANGFSRGKAVVITLILAFFTGVAAFALRFA
jgi:hypothetical protein